MDNFKATTPPILEGPPPAPAKPSFTSKTLLANAGVMGTALLDPHAAAFVSSHPIPVLVAVNLINIILRFLTHRRVSLFGSN